MKLSNLNGKYVMRSVISGFVLSLFVVALPALAPAAMADALKDGDLYRAETIVTGTEEPERSRGFAATFTQMLAKLTGDAALADRPVASFTQEDLTRFIIRREYEDRMKGIPVHDEQGTRDRPHFLRVAFHPERVNALLHRLGLEKWPLPRPIVHIRVTVDTGATRFFLLATGAQGYGQRASLVSAAGKMALPISLPKTQADGNTPGCATTPCLSGVLKLVDGGYWNVSWSLQSAESNVDWTLERVSFDTAFRSAIARASRLLKRAQAKSNQ